MARAHRDEGSSYRGPTPAPLAPPKWQRRVFVERPGELAALAERLAAAHVIAIDAEFVQPRVRAAGEPTQRLALLQFAIDDGYEASYVVDALRLADLSRLQPSLENGAILKLFHGVSADARALATRDLYARHILDLEAVSRSIFGQRESGLQTMLQRACGIRLDKTFQRADWGRRPLTPAMIAYAAHDAEMTYVLFGWLTTHYPWAVVAHELPADPAPPAVAEWILPALESPQMRSVELALAESVPSGETGAQERDLTQALSAVTYPSHRARVLRLIGELELASLAPIVRPYLAGLTTEERAGAARTLGRLRDWQSQPALEALLGDPVHDVRQAAETALELLKHGPPKPVSRHERLDAAARDGSLGGSHGGARGARAGPRTWVVEGGGTRPGAAHDTDDLEDPHDWRTALRRRFGVGVSDREDQSADGTAGSNGDDVNESRAPASDDEK